MSSEPNQKHLQTALYHARIIQHKKDVEMRIFESLETLLDYPLSENAVAESPTEKDVMEVTKLLQLFRPSDFEDLVDERRMGERCGYPLCPREPLKQPGSGKFRIVHQKRDIQVVPKEKLESWCSPACARRCVFLKGQFSREPAWTRQQNHIPSFEFPIGDPKDGKTTVWKPESVKLEPTDLESISQSVAKLAFRPKAGSGLSIEHSSNILSDSVIEKPTIRAPEEPRLDDDSAHETIEGFHPGGDIDIDRKGFTSLIR